MKTKIEQLVAEELARANKKFPGFSSNHEAHSVLREEIEELAEFVSAIVAPRIGWEAELWDLIKANNTTDLPECLNMLRHATMRAIEEAIQVAAMCDKWQQFLDKENDRG